MTSAKETPRPSSERPRLNYDILNRIYAHKSKKNGETLLRPWTIRQMSPSCGEPLKELMAKKNVRQRSNYLQWKLMLIVQAACRQVQQTVKHVKAGMTDFFRRDPIRNKGDQEEILGDGTDINRGYSEESNQEL